MFIGSLIGLADDFYSVWKKYNGGDKFCQVVWFFDGLYGAFGFIINWEDGISIPLSEKYFWEYFYSFCFCNDGDFTGGVIFGLDGLWWNFRHYFRFLWRYRLFQTK